MVTDAAYFAALTVGPAIAAGLLSAIVLRRRGAGFGSRFVWTVAVSTAVGVVWVFVRIGIEPTTGAWLAAVVTSAAVGALSFLGLFLVERYRQA